MTDLSLILLDDIIEELQKRFDVFIFVHIKNVSKTEEDVELHWHGGKVGGIGLCEFAKAKLTELMNKKDDNP